MAPITMALTMACRLKKKTLLDNAGFSAGWFCELLMAPSNEGETGMAELCLGLFILD